MSEFVDGRNRAGSGYTLDSAFKAWEVANPELFAEYQYQAARRGAKALLKDVIDSAGLSAMISRRDSDQLEFHGFELAASYTIPNPEGGGDLYVPALSMTLPLFEEHRRILDGNIDAAIEKRARFDETVDRLRPYLVTDETTVGEALAVLPTSERG
jgi:hypothetical protein